MSNQHLDIDSILKTIDAVKRRRGRFINEKDDGGTQMDCLNTIEGALGVYRKFLDRDCSRWDRFENVYTDLIEDEEITMEHRLVAAADLLDDIVDAQTNGRVVLSPSGKTRLARASVEEYNRTPDSTPEKAEGFFEWGDMRVAVMTVLERVLQDPDSI